MNLEELFNDHDDDGFVILNEGMGQEQTDHMRSLVSQSKEMVNKLDDKMSKKFRKEFNRQLIRFNTALEKKNLRNIVGQLERAENIYRKYNSKV